MILKFLLLKVGNIMHSHFKGIYINYMLAMDALINLKQGTRELYNTLRLFYICSGFNNNKTSETKEKKNQMPVMV